MPGLVRGVARTAAIAGTATAVSNRVSRRQAGRWSDQQAQQQQQQQQAPPPQYEQQPYQDQGYQQPAPPPPAAPPEVDMEVRLARLKELAQLKEMGVLTDFEFETQKQEILNS